MKHAPAITVTVANDPCVATLATQLFISGKAPTIERSIELAMEIVATTNETLRKEGWIK